MHKIFTFFGRAHSVAGACGILFLMCLSGCALKNPFAQTSVDPAAYSTEGVLATKEGRFLGILSPYRIDVQQGNFISSEIMIQLREGMKRKEGMTRDQVRFLLGTPLISDVFHSDRWDYIFRLQKGNGEMLTSHLTAFFKGSQLASVDGTNLPTEKDYISLIAGNRPVR